MAIEYSTNAVHPRDSLSYWREAATKAFVRHSFASLNGRPNYQGDIRAGWLDGLGVSGFHCDACEVTRSTRDIAREDSDHILLCLQLARRGLFTQEGRQAVNEQGSFLLLDTRRPFTMVFPEHHRSITFKIAREALEARVGNIAGLTARAMSSEGSVAGLASAFLSRLPDCLDAADGPAALKLAEQALDLVALATSSELGRSGTSLSSARAAALFRLKSIIEARLREPDLKPSAVATEAGISVRYANALLSQEGYSVERYILHRRLERCRRAIEDRTQAARTIGEIAFAWGFSDLSHFIRRFRGAYALAPSDYRRRAYAATAASPEEIAAPCPTGHVEKTG